MKAEKLTIAHISDLHRSKSNPISNVALLNSLIHDVDTYTNQGISKPDILIVSGDIVQGGATNDHLIEQYSEATDFLGKLATELFNGDRSRIILIPGNHDVSWSDSKKSMEKIEEKEITNINGSLANHILEQAMKIDSNVKWSWRDRSFYRIIDENVYRNRLSCFSDFYKNFYNKHRTFSLDPSEQFDIFDFQELGVTIVGFNSCFHNDHLNRAGSINPKCIANVGFRLRDYNKQGRLILATWHHNTKGAPYAQDYIDDTFIKNLISDSIKIGFHGHQHKQEILKVQSNIIDGQMMIILSAGSLCAAPSDLPSGYNQQYNLLELSRIDDKKIQLKLFSRAKTSESSFDNPIWGRGLFDSVHTEFTTQINHPKPKVPDLGKAEILLGEKKYREAQDILEQHNLEDPLVRTLLLECCEKLENYHSIIQYFSNPQKNSECIAILNASIEIGDKAKFTQLLNTEIIANSLDSSVMHLRNQIKGKIK